MGTDPSLAYQGHVARQTTDARAVFGQTMGLVAFTVGFFALGAWIGRDIEGLAGIFILLGAFIPLLGLNVAVRRGSQQLAIGLLFTFGLMFGLALGPVLSEYASANPAALWQAGGATALFIAGFGAYGYATSRDLSSWSRFLFFGLLGLIAVGIVFIFVSIPGENIIWAVLGLGLFALLTIFDFNRLRRAGMEVAPLIAASIFLDVVNVFLFFLQLFGGGRD
ncbi:MAG: Bax inhibitor-1 family protein [Solirubrobacteraceae bacterium]|nr:Bax inhibitor-1 family protein [Solirubrobacteraceae bacterium]